MIQWKPLMERHQEGQTPIGKVWIRLDRENRVEAWYSCFGETQKWCAQEGDSIELARELLAEEYNRVLFSRRLAEKNR